jgi:hypothetical protein
MNASTRSRRLLRTAVAGCAVVGTVVVATQPASAESSRVPHCIAPAGRDVPAGTDLNVLFGETAVIASNYYGCSTVPAGSTWTVITGFYFAKSWQQVPSGYVPSGATPLQDFVSKFVGMRITVDQGTPNEFSTLFRSGPNLWTGNLSGYDPYIGDYGQYDWAQPMTIMAMRPLSAGRHTVTKSVIMSAQQCDGNDSDPALSCLPAGETVLSSGAEYTWVAR